LARNAILFGVNKHFSPRNCKLKEILSLKFTKQFSRTSISKYLINKRLSKPMKDLHIILE